MASNRVEGILEQEALYMYSSKSRWIGLRASGMWLGVPLARDADEATAVVHPRQNRNILCFLLDYRSAN